MSDIVGELQNMADDPDTRAIDRMMAEAAAAEITRLRAALAAETERCAKVAEERAERLRSASLAGIGYAKLGFQWQAATADMIAAAIREKTE